MDNPIGTDMSGQAPVRPDMWQALSNLALDVRWSWNHAADEIWRFLDPALWELTHNPWVVLQTVSRDRLARVLADPGFRRQVEQLVVERQRLSDAPGWFQRQHPVSPLSGVAYFCMEYMLCEALPIYCGGLGNVAGDHLKAASDLGLPVVGVGLLYQQGYFRQAIDRAGGQHAFFPYNDPGQLPIRPLRRADGEWLRPNIDLPGYSVWLRAWEVQVGRVRLLLLDSNDPANLPAHRGITTELYGGGPETRLQQEIVLGIGGLRLLSALGLRPEVCHLNEGHSAFVVLERARAFMEETGQTFEAALSATRAGNVFTTHTATPAGFDRFPPALIEHYLGGYAQQLGISEPDLLALGRANARDASEPFNMAYLAIRGSGTVNAVSRLHEQVTRRILAPLFPRWPIAEIPVGHVTNGVHMPSWDSAAADELWTESCGKARWRGEVEGLEERLRAVPDARLWRMCEEARRMLVRYARRLLTRQLIAAGESAEQVDRVREVLDPDTLTLGFARRFAAYKRPTLLLADPQRLQRLLTDPDRPVQLVIAGKAHPGDAAGQAMIQQWIEFVRRPEIRRHAVFLADHDMLMTERLVQGADVWLNTPRRPWEASGTSGMKALVNGGLNLSELDGWWAEAYAPDVGWKLGDGEVHDDDTAWDRAEADALYALIEQEVAPMFYARDANGIPSAWVAKVRESMARLTPRYSATRMVSEYTDRYYVPAAAAFQARAADRGARAAECVEWSRSFRRKWPGVRLTEVKVDTSHAVHVFTARVLLDGLDPAAVNVELYADGVNGERPVHCEMSRDTQAGTGNGFAYRASVPATRPVTDFTVRISPHHAGLSVPLESDEILWQR